jgi:hypothetical protein
MERQPNIRRLTISRYYTEALRKERPYLRLKGKWLAQAGFESGTYVRVEVEQGRLVITPLPPDLKAVTEEIESLETQLVVLREREARYGGLL